MSEFIEIIPRPIQQQGCRRLFDLEDRSDSLRDGESAVSEIGKGDLGPHSCAGTFRGHARGTVPAIFRGRRRREIDRGPRSRASAR